MTKQAKKAAKTVKVRPEEAIAKMGGNIAPLNDEIREGYEKIEKLKEERSAINAKIKAIRETINAKGIVKDAFDAAMAYVNMAPERRDGFDTAYIIAREALGAPVKGAQADLFDKMDGSNDDLGAEADNTPQSVRTWIDEVTSEESKEQ